MEFLTPYMSVIVMAIVAAALILVGLLVYKLLNGNVRGRKGSRLGISEYHEIDKTRRLILLRRDDVEHLVLIGGGQDVVIENNIGSPLTTAAPAPMRPESFRPEPLRQAPRSPVFAGRRPNLRPAESNMDDDGRM